VSRPTQTNAPTTRRVDGTVARLAGMVWFVFRTRIAPVGCVKVERASVAATMHKTTMKVAWTVVAASAVNVVAMENLATFIRIVLPASVSPVPVLVWLATISTGTATKRVRTVEATNVPAVAKLRRVVRPVPIVPRVTATWPRQMPVVLENAVCRSRMNFVPEACSMKIEVKR